MSEVMGIRLKDDEKELIERAAASERQLGDRKGVSSWARGVLLREARRVVKAAEQEVSE